MDVFNNWWWWQSSFLLGLLICTVKDHNSGRRLEWGVNVIVSVLATFSSTAILYAVLWLVS